jgi:hypothetical protein
VIDVMWSGGRTTTSSGCAAYVAASATRSLPTCASASGTGPIVRTCLSPGHLSSSPTARSVKTGSTISVVISASLMT